MKDSAEIDPTVDPLYVASALIFSSLLGKGGSLISLLYISMISIFLSIKSEISIHRFGLKESEYKSDANSVSESTS